EQRPRRIRLCLSRACAEEGGVRPSGPSRPSSSPAHAGPEPYGLPARTVGPPEQPQAGKSAPQGDSDGSDSYDGSIPPPDARLRKSEQTIEGRAIEPIGGPADRAETIVAAGRRRRRGAADRP